MAEPYRIVIGLEVHVQLLTKTKLFCGCSTKFGQSPNSATCPVCLGLPGVLPVMNRQAFELALKAGTALNCEIASFTKWDRKNYFYPDLPKNFQTSQYDLPFSHDGWLEIETGKGLKKIGIIRVHLEEDAGKLIHDEKGGGQSSLVDLNRTGTPLLEIVSEPDISSPEEAKIYLEEIRLMMRDLEVSDCEMQEGSLRCDANVNLHIDQKNGETAATPIVEVKNLNSFRAVERALRYEAGRQFDEFEQTGKKLGDPGVTKVTAGWNEAQGITVVQRRKEEEADYRYFPEPDLVPVIVDDEWRNSIRANLGELPAAARRRLQSVYGLSSYDVGELTQRGRAFVGYFDRVAKSCNDGKAACNWMTNQVAAILNERKIDISEFPLKADNLGRLIKTVGEIGLNKNKAGKVLHEMIESGSSPKDAVQKLGFEVLSDKNQLLDIIRKAILANGKAIADYKNGKAKALDAVKGAIMRQTRGMAKFDVVQRLLLEELNKKNSTDSQ